DLGHMKALDEAGATLIAKKSARVLCVGFTCDPDSTAACYREGVPELSRSVRPDREGHGGEWETSLALHAFPEMVKRETISQLEPNFDYDVEAFRGETQDYWTLSGGRSYFPSPQPWAWLCRLTAVGERGDREEGRRNSWAKHCAGDPKCLGTGQVKESPIAFPQRTIDKQNRPNRGASRKVHKTEFHYRFVLCFRF